MYRFIYIYILFSNTITYTCFFNFKSPLSLLNIQETDQTTSSIQPRTPRNNTVSDSKDSSPNNKYTLQKTPSFLPFLRTNSLTPLMNAARNGNLEEITLLLKQNVDVNAKDNNGKTALHYTAFATKNIQPIATLLITHQANINAQDNDGNTPLHIGISQNTEELVKILLENGASTGICNNNNHALIPHIITTHNSYTTQNKYLQMIITHNKS